MLPYNLKLHLQNRISSTNLEGCVEQQLIDWYSEGVQLLMGPLWSQLYNEIIIIYTTVFCVIPFVSELLGFGWLVFFFRRYIYCI